MELGSEAKGRQPWKAASWERQAEAGMSCLGQRQEEAGHRAEGRQGGEEAHDSFIFGFFRALQGR